MPAKIIENDQCHKSCYYNSIIKHELYSNVFFKVWKTYSLEAMKHWGDKLRRIWIKVTLYHIHGLELNTIKLWTLPKISNVLPNFFYIFLVEIDKPT